MPETSWVRLSISITFAITACSDPKDEPRPAPVPAMGFEACVLEGTPPGQPIGMMLVAEEITIQRIARCGALVPKGHPAGIREALDEKLKFPFINAPQLCELFDRGRRSDGKPLLSGCATEVTIGPAAQLAEGAQVPGMRTRAHDRDRRFYVDLVRDNGLLRRRTRDGVTWEELAGPDTVTDPLQLHWRNADAFAITTEPNVPEAQLHVRERDRWKPAGRARIGRVLDARRTSSGWTTVGLRDDAPLVMRLDAGMQRVLATHVLPLGKLGAVAMNGVVLEDGTVIAGGTDGKRMVIWRVDPKGAIRTEEVAIEARGASAVLACVDRRTVHFVVHDGGAVVTVTPDAIHSLPMSRPSWIVNTACRDGRVDTIGREQIGSPILLSRCKLATQRCETFPLAIVRVGGIGIGYRDDGVVAFTYARGSVSDLENGIVIAHVLRDDATQPRAAEVWTSKRDPVLRYHDQVVLLRDRLF